MHRSSNAARLSPRAASSRASRGTTEFGPFSAGGADLLGACFHISDKLIAAARLSTPDPAASSTAARPIRHLLKPRSSSSNEDSRTERSSSLGGLTRRFVTDDRVQEVHRESAEGVSGRSSSLPLVGSSSSPLLRRPFLWPEPPRACSPSNNSPRDRRTRTSDSCRPSGWEYPWSRVW